MTTLFHRSPMGAAIAATGFRDAEGCYMTSEVWRGVWLSDNPLDENEGAKGADLLAVDIPLEAIADYEWVEEGKSYREWLVPAEVVNGYPRRLLTADEGQA